jgi:hypothetical protein
MPCPTIIHLPFTCQKITTIHLEGLITGNQTLHLPESLTYIHACFWFHSTMFPEATLMDADGIHTQR